MEVEGNLSYRRSWSKTFTVDEFNVDGHVPSPWKCPDHLNTEGRSLCFRTGDVWYSPVHPEGWWRLKLPVNIPSVMPGSRQKLLTVGIKGMKKLGWGTYFHGSSDVEVLLDGAKIFEHKGLGHGDWAWELNNLEVMLSLEGGISLDVGLWQAWVAETGSIELHDAELRLDAEYYSVIPPETAEVRITVRNSKTRTLVKGARVALMSGTRVVAESFTDGGEVNFLRVDEGSYSIKVLASGYYEFEQAVDVEPPSTWYEVRIVPVEKEPTSDWVTYAVIGVGTIAALSIVPPLLKRERKEERVIVVR